MIGISVLASPHKATFLRALIGMIAGMLLSAGMANASSLAAIQARGKLVVGVKADSNPWGYRDKDGKLIGFEPDLAHHLAARMGVKLELVGVSSSERVVVLNRGRIDVMIATFAVTGERLEQANLIKPYYYTSGVNLLSAKKDGFRNWSELTNRRVCSRQGSFYNRPITVQYAIDIVAFHSMLWAKRALRDGRCSALLNDNVAIGADLLDPAWSKEFEMAMPSLYSTPWAIAIVKRETGGLLEKFISSTVIGWHRDGVLKALENQWKIVPTEFILKMNAVWSKKNPDGTWYCGSEVTSTTPAVCLAPLEHSGGTQ